MLVLFDFADGDKDGKVTLEGFKEALKQPIVSNTIGINWENVPMAETGDSTGDSENNNSGATITE